MNLGERLKTIREAKQLAQKKVALSIQMDPSQYSKIEKGKTDPSVSTLQKIAQALDVTMADLFAEPKDWEAVNSYDKSALEKLQLLELLDEEEQQSLFRIIDGLVSKQRLKDNLTNVLQSA